MKIPNPFLVAAGAFLVSLHPAFGQGRADSRSVQMPLVTVVGTAVPGENKIIGSYGQPEWTARRPFPGLSVYVVPDGEYELELTNDQRAFAAGEIHRDWRQELEVGLGHRFQLALENSFQNFREVGSQSAGWHDDSGLMTLRYAFADWGKLPFNPACSVGWRFNSGNPGACQLGLVVGDELNPRWHWAANGGVEQQVGGVRFRQMSCDGVLTYSIANETLNLGAQAGWERDRGGDVAPSSFLRAGPCIQLRPWDEAHFNLAYLWSDRSRNAPRYEVLVSVGIEFGEGADDHDNDSKQGGKFDR